MLKISGKQFINVNYHKLINETHYTRLYGAKKTIVVFGSINCFKYSFFKKGRKKTVDKVKRGVFGVIFAVKPNAKSLSF